MVLRTWHKCAGHRIHTHSALWQHVWAIWIQYYNGLVLICHWLWPHEVEARLARYGCVLKRKNLYMWFYTVIRYYNVLRMSNVLHHFITEFAKLSLRLQWNSLKFIINHSPFCVCIYIYRHSSKIRLRVGLSGNACNLLFGRRLIWILAGMEYPNSGCSWIRSALPGERQMVPWKSLQVHWIWYEAVK